MNVDSDAQEVHMRFSQLIVRAIGVAACLVVLAAPGSAQAPATAAPPAPPVIPENAMALEGQPTIRVDASKESATRRKLASAEATKHRLKISIVDGNYYWSSQENRPLTLAASGEFTYLSAEPGQYIRLRKINDKLEYVEHVDKDFVSVTFWGELRVILKK
jgi:hypothetical protein